MKAKIILWLKKNLAFILAGIFMFCMIACFISGCNYHKNHFKSPEAQTVTIEVRDTGWYHIVDSLNHVVDSLKNKPQPDPVIVYQPGEKIPIPADVDTAAILARHYTTFRYYWQFPEKFTPGDSIRIKLNTTISENKPLVYDLSYQWLKPQTIVNNTVDNSVHYNKYLYVGLDLPFYKMENAEITALYAFSRGYLGGGYAPFAKGFSLKTGVTLLKFK